jgi:regulatory protein
MVVRFPSEPHPGADSGAGAPPAGMPRSARGRSSEERSVEGQSPEGLSSEERSGEGWSPEGPSPEVQPPVGSSSESPQSEHLAPVTPLRRAKASPERRHPSRSVARPVAELPGAAAADGVAGAETTGATERWNNTWAAEPSRASGGAAPEGASLAADDPEAEDEETERLTRKTTALTIRQLARRGMSRWELEQLLIKREIVPEVFAPELDRLEAMGVIDDASLAATLAFTQHSRKGLGRSAIELDLKRRHIAPELIEEALADIADEDELERATELAVKRIGQLSSYDDETTRRRLHGFLARKGYGSSVVRQAMDAAFATRGRRGGVRFQ